MVKDKEKLEDNILLDQNVLESELNGWKLWESTKKVDAEYKQAMQQFEMNSKQLEDRISKLAAMLEKIEGSNDINLSLDDFLESSREAKGLASDLYELRDIYQKLEANKRKAKVQFFHKFRKAYYSDLNYIHMKVDELETDKVAKLVRALLTNGIAEIGGKIYQESIECVNTIESLASEINKVPLEGSKHNEYEGVRTAWALPVIGDLGRFTVVNYQSLVIEEQQARNIASFGYKPYRKDLENDGGL